MVPAAHWSPSSWKDCRVASDQSSKESVLEAASADGSPEADGDAEASPEAEGSSEPVESPVSLQVMAVEDPTPRGSKPMMS